MGRRRIGRRAAFWKEMSEALPDAIVILSVRDPEEWW